MARASPWSGSTASPSPRPASGSPTPRAWCWSSPALTWAASPLPPSSGSWTTSRSGRKLNRGNKNFLSQDLSTSNIDVSYPILGLKILRPIRNLATRWGWHWEGLRFSAAHYSPVKLSRKLFTKIQVPRTIKLILDGYSFNGQHCTDTFKTYLH